jgi:hypothetical protein
MNVENHIYVENPMNAVFIPVAEVVGIEVMGEVVIEPKRKTNRDSCFDKFKNIVAIIVPVLFMFSLLCGLIAFVIFLLAPKILESREEPDD